MSSQFNWGRTCYTYGHLLIGVHKSAKLRFLPLSIMVSSKYWSIFAPSLPLGFFYCHFVRLSIYGGCALTFAGIMSRMLEFFQLSMLDLNKRPQLWPNYLKWWCSLFLSQQTELAQSNTMPVKIAMVFRKRNKKHKWKLLRSNCLWCCFYAIQGGSNF